MYCSDVVKVIDETLRIVTFSLMVFREAKSDVNISGQFCSELNPFFFTWFT